VRYDFVDLFDIVGYFTGTHDDASASGTAKSTESSPEGRHQEGGGVSDKIDQRSRPQEAGRMRREAGRAEELARRDKIAEDIGMRGREFALNRMR
jgi:hypothetical protein